MTPMSATIAPPETQAEPVLRTHALTKRFGQVLALDRASLAVPPGCTGLLGPNGAGKSTLIRLALGLLSPDAGEATVAGFDPVHQPLALRAAVGYMPEHDCLPSDWLAQDFVRYMAELHGMPRRAAIGRANDTLYHVGLGEERFRAIGGFSTGMKQRIKLAQALVHDPHVLLLDEPTNGLDPAGRDEMLALIDRIAHEMGIDVLLSSHLLSDVERVADHVAIISGGRVLVQGALRDLMAATPMVTVRTYAPVLPLAEALRARGYTVEAGERELHLACNDDADYDALRDATVETGSIVVHLKRRSLSLEDIYLAGAESTPMDVGAHALPEEVPA